MIRIFVLTLLGAACVFPQARATPANRAALEKHFGPFLTKSLRQCTTCHLASTNTAPESLDEFPHNPFGDRLKRAGQELARKGRPKTISARLDLVAREDADGDGVDNITELLLGHAPGDPADRPDTKDLALGKAKQAEFKKYLASYKWTPFEKLKEPALPAISKQQKLWGRNGIDAFISAGQTEHGLTPRPEASKEVLLRRAYLDLIGLNPSPAEREEFLADKRSDAYERLVDRLLEDPRYGERWGRHWMDVWRYSDWAGWSGGNQIRDSQPHIWRWRDWIVESLNEDKPYDRMIVEMLAGDEIAPEDEKTLRATGFLVRNYKMLSREQWLEDTVKHTSQAFLGVTMGCAKCHNHMYDPISQAEYYQLRAIFEPHQVRTDRLPGELDRLKKGLVRAYDTGSNAPTYFYIRGDERKPDTNRIMAPGVPAALKGGAPFEIQAIHLPTSAAAPDRREFVVRDTLAESERKIAEAERALEKERAGTNHVKLEEARLRAELARRQHAALQAVLKVETLEERKDSPEWKEAAQQALEAQRKAALIEARLNANAAAQALAEAEAKLERASEKDKEKKKIEDLGKKRDEAEKKLTQARQECDAPLSTAFKPRDAAAFPIESTGRRLAFAKWVANKDNPLTARVAANHIWLRHFGRGLVGSPADFGANGKPPLNPRFVDWLAVQFLKENWSMKALHRLIMTSSTYRMSSTPDAKDEAIDPDNLWYWRMPSRRMEAEIVRDNLLLAGGDLDLTQGGPEVDHLLGLKSKRRSIYLRIAPEKEVEFLKIFDGPSVTECYERRPSVMPQQALALANSELAIAEARKLAKSIAADCQGGDQTFVRKAYERVLARDPLPAELTACLEFLQKKEPARQRENLALVLLNHNDFVTIR